MAEVALPGWKKAAASGKAGEVCTVNRAATQAIPDNTVTAVQWDTEREDLPGWFSPASPTYIQVTEAGVYVAHAGVVVAANLTGEQRSLHLQQNGVMGGAWGADGPILDAQSMRYPWLYEQELKVSWQGRLAAGDKLSVWAFQRTTPTGALNIGGRNRPLNASANNEFSVLRIA